MVDQQTPWTACCQNDLTADQPYQQTRTPVHHPHQQAEAMMNSSRTQQTLEWTTTYEGLGVHKNIPVSNTKLTLGLRVGFVSSHLTEDKLFLVNARAITGPPKMSLLLEVKSTPALIVKPRLILVMHTDDLGRYITPNQQRQMLVQNLKKIVSRPNVTPRQVLYYTTNCIPINLVFQENFPTNSSLEPPVPSK